MAAVLEYLIGEVLDEKYRLDEKLGQGGMGAVYLATHMGTERHVALKVIAPQFMAHPEFVERFKREAKAAGRLRHPNVVNVTDFGFATVNNQRLAYLVMEYLDGCTLGEVLSEESRLPLGFVVDIIEQVCSAVDEAHKQGIIHRDLKPDNIWLEPNGRGGYTVKVLDFGLAKLGDVPPPRTSSDNVINLPDEPCMISKLLGKNETGNGATGNLKNVGHNGSNGNGSNGNGATGNGNGSHNDRPLIAATPAQLEAAVAMSAITAVQPGLSTAEAATMAQPLVNINSLQSGVETNGDSDEIETRVHLQRMTARNLEQPTAKAGITNVGTVLGTPLYMSPEQCLGDRLDTRTDIYSIGVIAYQMLSGKTPFTGDTNSLIVQHTQIAPRALKELRRDIPKSIAALIMSTLAKNPAERPGNAIALANALRARAEGAGSHLRQAISLYGQHFPTFFKISLIAHAPMILFTELSVVHQLWLYKMMSTPMGKVSTTIILAGIVITDIFAKSVTASAITPAVAQLLVAPLRQVEIRSLFMVVKERFVALIITCLYFHVLTRVGGLLLVIPGIIMSINYSLHMPIVIMEGLQGMAALRRSQQLVRQLKRTVVTVLIINLIGCSISGIFSLFSTQGIAATLKLPISDSFLGVIIASMSATMNVVVFPLVAISLAMLYFKTRQASGETLKEALGAFTQENYRSKWQQRISERIHKRTEMLKISRSSQS